MHKDLPKTLNIHLNGSAPEFKDGERDSKLTHNNNWYIWEIRTTVVSELIGCETDLIDPHAN